MRTPNKSRNHYSRSMWCWTHKGATQRKMIAGEKLSTYSFPEKKAPLEKGAGMHMRKIKQFIVDRHPHDFALPASYLCDVAAVASFVLC